MPSEHLRRRLANLPWPETEDTTTAEPTPGDLWAAEWEGTRALVFILAADTTTVEVSAASTPITGNDHTVIVPEDQSPVPGAAVHIWATIHAALPRRALDQRLGRAPYLLDTVAAATITPTGTFPPITGALDPRGEEQARLEDNLGALAEARWQPDTHELLRDLIPTLRPGRLAELTGLEPGAADQVLEGKAPLTGDQAGAVAEAYALSSIQVSRAANPRVDDNVVSFFEAPARLRAVRERARSQGRTEPEVMLDIALPLVLQAARTTGYADRDWGALIDDALRP